MLSTLFISVFVPIKNSPTCNTLYFYTYIFEKNHTNKTTYVVVYPLAEPKKKAPRVYQYIDIFHSNASPMIVSYDVQLGAKYTNSYEYNDSYGGT
jgi:hypothetical protein